MLLAADKIGLLLLPLLLFSFDPIPAVLFSMPWFIAVVALALFLAARAAGSASVVAARRGFTATLRFRRSQ